MKKIFNPFKSTQDKCEYYHVYSESVKKVGAYSVYNLPCSQIITFGNIAIQETVKVSDEILHSLNTNKEPSEKYKFLFERAKEWRYKASKMYNRYKPEQK